MFEGNLSICIATTYFAENFNQDVNKKCRLSENMLNIDNYKNTVIDCT